MNTAIQTEYSVKTYSEPIQRTHSTGRREFLEVIATKLTTSETRASGPSAPSAEEYKAYLEKRFGPVTLQSVGKDQKSLEAVGKRMRGNDIYIAPNIFEEMVSDRETAAYYEKKISYFFTDVIPNGEAYAQSVGLTFEPCGVVIHEDGTVTYICGGGDPPEKVAKVEAENRAKQQTRAKRRKELAEFAAEQAVQRRELWAALAKGQSMKAENIPANSDYLGDWLKIQRIAFPSFSASETNSMNFHIMGFSDL